MRKSLETEIGYVIEVSGDRAIVELTVDTTVPLDGDYYPGQPGSHVKIPFRDLNIIGTVANIRMLDVTPSARPGQEAAGETISKKVAECLLIGTLSHEGQFARGVAVYPNVGQKVRMVGLEEIKEIFSEFVSQDFSFARLAQAEDQRAFIHVDRFFGRHTAILGTTGSGKSCTVTSILQRTIEKYPDTHILVIDLHGEYATAFPNDTQLIEADKVELPYWLLNFEEFQDLAVDVTEFTAHNQITGLRDALLQARQKTDEAEGLGLGNAVTVDSPIYFDLQEMLQQIRNWNKKMVPGAKGKEKKGPLHGIFDRFLIRFDSRINDPRFRFMFSPTNYSGNASLPQLLKEYLSIDTGKRMTVIDLSGIPFEAVGVVVSVVSRVVYEFNFWNPDRRKFPILMVFEEAHNYIPNRPEAKFSAARAAVERLAKEGRKYGIGVIVVSQRPKELSETVISQCNTFIVMRLTNPEDQNYVRRLVPDSLAGLMNMLPSLRTGEALIIGDSVVMPTRVLIDFPRPEPKSADVKFAEHWAKGIQNMDVDRIVKRWRARRKDL
ncbi:MAG: ATPase [Deltaproteobacteria bacterium]|nr:MAG: ATPase [Deltaproteobacteria bacterium]RLB05384.1 MAG: ATPase [Deltaproteobacteria bacterium]